MKEKREKQIKEQQQKLLDLLQKKTREFVAKNADIAEIKLFGKMNTEGQHLRGMLLLLSYAACSEAQEKMDSALQLAVAMKFLQTSILIQDDIIDKSDMRRGRASLHKALFRDKNASFSKSERDANTAAALIGGMGIAYATKLIHEICENEEASGREIVKEYCTMLVNTLHGEAMDILVPVYNGDESDKFDDKVRRELALEIAIRKTAVYSFETPIVMGILLAGKRSEEILWARRLGCHLGRIYQLSNDRKAVEGLQTKDDVCTDVAPYRLSYANAIALGTEKEESEKFQGILLKENKTQRDKKWIQEHYPYDKVYTQLDEKQKESCGWALKELNSGDCCFSPEGVAVLKQFLKKFEGMESFENG